MQPRGPPECTNGGAASRKVVSSTVRAPTKSLTTGAQEAASAAAASLPPFDQQLPSLPDAGIIMPVSAMSRVAIAIAAHGLPGLTGILSVPIEGTHSLSLTVVRAYSAAGGGWAVQQGRGHVLATWLAMAGPCCGGRALALRLDRGSGGASKPHPVTQEVVLDACTGHPTGIHESTGPSCRLWALLGGFGGPGEQ